MNQVKMGIGGSGIALGAFWSTQHRKSLIKIEDHFDIYFIFII
jgi:hypothetical protein